MEQRAVGKNKFKIGLVWLLLLDSRLLFSSNCNDSNWRSLFGSLIDRGVVNFATAVSICGLGAACLWQYHQNKKVQKKLDESKIENLKQRCWLAESRDLLNFAEDEAADLHAEVVSLNHEIVSLRAKVADFHKNLLVTKWCADFYRQNLYAISARKANLGPRLCKK